MRPPLNLVTLILFAVAATATPPPGHVHRPSDDDKDPPSYQYGYEIGDVAGKESQGKVETRSGELASGRYYVNEERASTDVKYFADEWGYHPLVKYSAADDHSSATAHFALGEHVVKALLNGTEVGEEVKLPIEKRQSIDHNLQQQSNLRRRPAQAAQSYTPGSATSSSGAKSPSADDHEPSATVAASPVNFQLNYDLQRAFSRRSKFHDASTASSGFQENFNNYVTLPRASANDRDHQRQSEIRSGYYSSAGTVSSTTPDYRSLSRASIYVTNPSTTGSSRNVLQVDSHHEHHDARHEGSNDLYSTLSDDLLLVQNAGSFGRRLNPAASSHLANVTESATQRLTTEAPQRPSATISPPYASPSTRTTPRAGDLEDRRQFSTTPIPDFHDLANSVSAEALSKEYRNSLNRESSLTGSYADIFAKIFSNGPSQESPAEESPTMNSQLLPYEPSDMNATATNLERATTPGLSAYGKRRDHELYVTLRESLDSEIRDSSRLYSSTPKTLSTFGSKPIVVAELLNYNRDKAFEYSTTFPCTDEGYPSSTTVAGLSSADESSMGLSDQILVTPKLQPSSGHATAVPVSNPLQGASSFARAGASEPIGSDDRSRVTPAPVRENIEGEAPNDEPFMNLSASRINELENLGDDRYERINPAFGQPFGSEAMDIAESAKFTGDRGAGSQGSDSRDQRIEIQKSVEIYQNSPVQEIHYPPQVISQVSGINQRVQQQQQQQQQREDSVGAVNQREEQSRSYVELQGAANAKQFQQRYNSLHDQQQQSISAHTAFEDGEGVHGTATVYRGNPVRVGNELTDYGAEKRNPPVNSEAAREDHREIIKIIRDRIPEVKYTPARTPQINVRVYGSAAREGGNKGQATETKQQGAGVMREQEIKAAPAGAEAQANKAQSQLHRILSESGGVQRYFSGAGWTRYQEQQQGRQEQQQGNQQGQQLGNRQEQKQGNQQGQQLGNRQEQKQGNQQEQQLGNRQEQKQENQQEQQVENRQEQQQGNRQEQKQGNQQGQQLGNRQEQKQGNQQEQQLGNRQEQKQENQQEQQVGNRQEQKQGNQQEQQVGNRQEQQQGHWQEVEPGHWQEQQQGLWQQQQQGLWREVEPGHWQEQQQGNQQEQQQGHWQEVQPGHWQEQQQGSRQEQQQVQRQEQQQGNRQEQQQGQRQEQQQGNRQEQQQGQHQEQQQGQGQEQQQGSRQEQQSGNRQGQQQGNRQELQPGNRQGQQQRLQELGKLEMLRPMPERSNQQQSIILSYDQYDISNKNLQQNYGNAMQEISQSRQMAPLAYLPPPVAERIVHKTIHVPQPYPVEVPRIIEKKVPYPVEKIVERKVPYPVEKIVEKKVPVPQPYPVHIQVPVDRIIEKQVLQPYPVHIEKIIEKKVPYPVQRLVPQPYPVHIIQPYPVETIVEKPVHVPVTVEKIVEKKVHVPQPYPVQVPIKVPYPVEITKYIGQSVHVPYGVRYGVSYQQIMKPQSTNGLYAHRESTSLPIYGLSLVSNQYRDPVNATQDFQGYTYSKPAVAFVSGHSESGGPQRSNGWEQFAYGKSSGSDNHHNQAFAKKSYVGQSSKLPQFIHNYPGTNKRQATYRQSNVLVGENTAGKDEYVGPVPAAQQQQTQSQSPSKPHQKSRSRSSSDHQQALLLQPVQQHSTLVTRTAPVSTSASSARRARQQEENPSHYQSGPGAFRQSKIEYGFKPPMVPSIQYDEKTATKVDN